MAFVFRADRDLNTSTTEPNDVGPGQYYLLHQNLKTEPTNLSIPFNTSEKRLKKILSFGPGPADYDTRKNILKKSFSINSTTPSHKSYDLYSNEEIENLFISSEPRFKDNNSNYLNPGPGYYNSLSQRASKKNLIPENKIIFNALSSKRINTIPSKQNSYGYAYDKKGDLNIQNDPKFRDKYSGEKDNSVGPGRYDINDKKKLLGNISFKNYLGHNLEKSKKEIINLSDFNFLFNDKKKERLISGFTRQKSKKEMKIYKNGDLVLKNNENHVEMDLTKLKKSRNSELITPGPGHYQSENYNSITTPKPKEIKYQNFGSSLSRSLNEIPRAYTNDILDNLKIFPSFQSNVNLNKYNYKNPIRPKSNIKINENQNKIISKLKELKKIQKTLVGPGRYNPKIKYNRPTSNIQKFNILSERFGSNDNGVPGAGSYLSLINHIPPHPEFNKEKFQEEMILIELNRKKQKDKNSGTSVFDYDINKFNSIESDVSKNYNVKRPPFNLGDGRFLDKIEYFNGPGSYNLRKDYNISEGKAPFNVSSERRDIGIQSDYDAGPASYDRNNYFDWNKKSFNALFL